VSFAIEPSPEISHRCDFSILANARGYLDAVEVGVDRGVFAAEFLRRWHGYSLTLIDPYLTYPEMPWIDRQLDMMTAVQAMAPYHGRVRFIRSTSVDVAAHWPEWIGRPQFVYVDGSHTEEDVAADLAAWWPLIQEGGMIAGHDHDAGHPGVLISVERFARERDLVVRLTHEQITPSWYCYKTESETLKVRLFTDGEMVNPHHRGAPS
jgi:hypothetical protein